MPVTLEGFTSPDIQERRLRMQAKFEELSGLVVNWDASEEFIAIMLEVALSEIMEVGEAPQAIWDATSPNNATGRALENIAALALITRNAETFSRATVTLGGTPGIFVPAGKVITHNVTKTRWRLLEDATIPADVIVEAETPGAVPAAVGTLTVIATAVSGWTSVTNAASATLGRPVETDAELRARRLRELARASTGTVPSITSAVADVDGVTGVKVVANNTGTDITVGGFTIPNTGVLVLVLPDPLTLDEQALLGTALLGVVGAGTRTVGAESVAVVDSGVEYTFYFDYATVVTVPVIVSTTLYPGYALVDVEDAINEALVDHFATLAIGGDVLLLPILGALADIQGLKSATVLLFATAADYVVADTQIAQFSGTATVT
jgi:uncharacterized phage protein gp47/JayE